MLADDISKERSYLSKASKFPFLSTTLLTYVLYTNYHSSAIDSNIDSLKKSFNILALLDLPVNSTENIYSGYINSSKNTKVENMLDQPSEKISGL